MLTLPETARSLLTYFGIMTASLSILSLPPAPPTLYYARAASPWVLAVIASVAAAVAAVFDYTLVRRVFRFRALARARENRFFGQFERMAKVAPFFTTVVFAALPLPFILPRVLMPLSGYPRSRYAAAVAIGRYPRVFVIAMFGQAFEIPPQVLIALFVGGALLGGVGALVRYLRHRKSPAPSPAAGGGEGA
jgi:uncharacterized membrane protein YdjX (TVP38/TMEM64 family)